MPCLWEKPAVELKAALCTGGGQPSCECCSTVSHPDHQPPASLAPKNQSSHPALPSLVPDLSAQPRSDFGSNLFQFLQDRSLGVPSVLDPNCLLHPRHLPWHQRPQLLGPSFLPTWRTAKCQRPHTNTSSLFTLTAAGLVPPAPKEGEPGNSILKGSITLYLELYVPYLFIYSFLP